MHRLIMIQLVIFIIFGSFLSSDAVTLNCKYDDESSTHGYACYANPIENPNPIKRVCGNHTGEKTNNDVAFLELTSKTLNFLPEGIKSQFPNLKAIKLNFDELVEIKEDDLKPFGEKLVFLSISTSKIEVLPSSLFASTPNINYIYFASSTLINIENNVFDNLDYLNGLFVNIPCIGEDNAINREDVEKNLKTMSIRCHDKNKPFNTKSRSTSVPDSNENCEGESDSESNTLIIIGIVLGILVAIGAAFGIIKMRKSNSANLNSNPVQYDSVQGRA